jgi:hypothetical protein
MKLAEGWKNGQERKKEEKGIYADARMETQGADAATYGKVLLLLGLRAIRSSESIPYVE